MIHLRKRLHLVLPVLLALGLIAGPVAPSDSPPAFPLITQIEEEPEPPAEAPKFEPGELMPLGQLLESLLALIVAFGAGVAVVAEPIINAYKLVANRWLPGLAKHTGVVAFVLPPILALVYFAADYLGYGDVFVIGANGIIDLLPRIIAMVSALAGTTLAYKGFKALGLPGLGATSEDFKPDNERASPELGMIG